MFIKKYYPKKKVIYINGRFLTQTITGVQRYALEIVKIIDRFISKGIIDKEKYEFILLIQRRNQHSLELNNIQIQKIGNLKGQLWEQLELPFFSSGYLLVNLCNTAPVLKTNQVLTIHDAAASANKENFSLFFRIWYQLLHRILPFRTKRILTVSNFSKNELLKYYPIQKDKMNVVYLGIEHMNDVQLDNKILCQYDLLSTKYILAVSSINPNKNFNGIIEALKYIKSEEVQIVIVGHRDNPIYKEADIPPSTKIKFVGYVTDEELKALYKNASCFVFPSFYEGFGLPPLEAMSSGCPVIASNRASLPEVLGDSALFCDPENPRDIAEKIEILLNNHNIRAVYQQRGLEKSRQYSWERCGKELIEVITEVIDL
ncbi:glycosyltransferase family 1 protein [Neobacillus piezotolerans]|uniref:Glycosyltransferase family 1 protein n=1 Tax=Neobacillus piezotolerans TaxID=2259171 RepID=A0A3D8GU34_9BACI|nr:glycosyltransferase family 1 protein [Neobacillus piezotolerans]RDU37556.1 glycosyltransferase family 1 protein [Neobacillus piezotolerans]